MPDESRNNSSGAANHGRPRWRDFAARFPRVRAGFLLEPLSLAVKAMFPRLVLGYVIALALTIPASARRPVREYTIAVTMQSLVPGVLQVYYDSGLGFSERQSAQTLLDSSDRMWEYRLPVPPGRYVGFRIDPGRLGGRYVLTGVRFLRPDGSLHAVVPLGAVAPAYQISLLDKGPERLVLQSPPGSNDPQLLYVPDNPVAIPEQPFRQLLRSVPALICLLWACCTGAVWLIERVFRAPSQVGPSLARAGAMCRSNPRGAVCLIAALATVVATYPVLLLGRSLVSPNIAGVPLLYSEAPFTPGSTDTTIEDQRGTDVGASPWQSIPHSHVEREALTSGEIPLWNRYNAAGRPLWGQGLTFLLDPIHWLTLMAPDLALGWDIKFVAHRFVFALGVGMVALTTTGALVPSVMVAAVAPFGGFFSYRLNHPAVFAVTYAPWVLLAWCQLVASDDRQRRATGSILLAISSALLLVAGTPKEGMVTLLGVEMAGVIAVLWSPGSWAERGRRVLAAGLAGMAVVLITMPHWLVFLETLRKTATLSDTPHVFFASRSHAIGFFLSPLGGPMQPSLHLLALVLVTAALSAPLRLAERRVVLACGVAAATLIAIAFGGLPASLLVRLPLLGNIGHVHDAFLAAALPLLLVVAGFGAAVLLTASARRVTLIAVTVGLACVVLMASLRVLADKDNVELGPLLSIVPIAIAVPCCVYAARNGAGLLLPPVAATCAIVILLLPWGLQLDSGIPVLDKLLLQPRPRTSVDLDSPAVEAVHRATTEPARTVGLEATLFAGSQALYQLESIGGADPLEAPAYRELMDAAGILMPGWGWLTMVSVRDVTRLSSFLDMLNVDFFLARPDEVPPGFVDIALRGADRLTAVRRATAWPRAFFVDGVSLCSDARDLLRKVAEHDGPMACVQATDRQAIDATRGTQIPASAFVRAMDYNLTINTTSFAVRTPGPGVAVLTETFLSDDFRATLNEHRVPYFRVNHAFKAVTIPSAGAWVVRFEYRPVHWNLSLIMAALGIVLLAALRVSARGPRYITTEPSEDPAGRASS